MSASKCKEHRRDVTDVGIGVAPLVVGVLAARVADAEEPASRHAARRLGDGCRQHRKRVKSQMQSDIPSEGQVVLLPPPAVAESLSVDDWLDAVDDSPIDNHSYFKWANIVAVGCPVVTCHPHPAGLTELQFENCVVKVRLGGDLNDLIRCSFTGPVALRNLSTHGWISIGLPILCAYFCHDLIIDDYQQVFPSSFVRIHSISV